MRPQIALLTLISLLCACGKKPAATAAETSEQALVRQVVAEQLKIDPSTIKMSMTFSDLAMNELALVEVIMELEERTKAHIPDEDLGRRAGGSAAVSQLVKNLKLQDLADSLALAKKNPPSTSPIASQPK